MGLIAETKQRVIQELLQELNYALIVVNPQYPGVQLPDYLMDAGQPIGINIGWRMTIPVPDLRIDEQGVSGTLSFNRTPFACQFPWAAIIQVTVDEEHLVWVTRDTIKPQKGKSQKGENESASPASPQRPHLRLVD